MTTQTILADYAKQIRQLYPALDADHLVKLCKPGTNWGVKVYLSPDRPLIITRQMLEEGFNFHYYLTINHYDRIRFTTEAAL